MLEIELDPSEQNNEGSLKVRKAPAWRYGFFATIVIPTKQPLSPINNTRKQP